MSKANETVEQKMQKLRELVAWFESEDFQLEKAAEKFKEASNFAMEIEKDLAELENDITVLKQSFSE